VNKYGAEFFGSFWLAPLVGGLLGAAIYRFIGSTDD
jgi:glycerol uptake facilitator-like aquaporin